MEEAADAPRGVFEQQNRLVSWGRLARRVEPFYPKPGRGRRRYPLRGMQRVHWVQLFYNLSAPGVEELFYEVESVRRFTGLRLTGSLPAETTALHWRRLLERHGPGSVLFGERNAHVALLGHGLQTVTVVGARSGRGAEFDAEQGRRSGSGDVPGEAGQSVAFRDEGAHWRDSQCGLTHSLAPPLANVSEVATGHGIVLHGRGDRVCGDGGQEGVGKGAEHRDAAVDWLVAMQRGQGRLLDQLGLTEAAERCKGLVRAKV